MKRAVCIFVAALTLLAPVLTPAHEVPDRVNIGMYVLQEQERLLILVRVPANGLIDILLPTLDGNWVDLANAGPLATEGANTWVADLLKFRDGERSLQRPEVVAVRLSRLNDPAFRSFDNAYARINGPALPKETLARQEDLTVDVMLRTPIGSATPQLFFEPRFARLGVTVQTSLKFLPLAGGVRDFQYESDPPIFELDPGLRASLSRLSHAGFGHFFDGTDYWLLTLVVALVFQSGRGLASFALTLAIAQAATLCAALFFMAEPFWLRGFCGTAIAGAIVFLGCESIIGGIAKRRMPAMLIGVIFGYGFWIGLQPILQFGGSHTLAGAMGFTVGALAAQCVALLSSAAILRLVSGLSRSPRRATIVIAAFAIHIAWRRFLDRADALALMPSEYQGIESTTLATIAVILALMFAIAAFYWRRGTEADTSKSR